MCVWKKLNSENLVSKRMLTQKYYRRENLNSENWHLTKFTTQKFALGKFALGKIVSKKLPPKTLSLGKSLLEKNIHLKIYPSKIISPVRKKWCSKKVYLRNLSFEKSGVPKNCY